MPSSSVGEILREFASPHSTRVLLVRGRSGSGKSELLSMIRQRAGDAATIVDDAHALDDAALTALADSVPSTPGPLIVAAEPRPRRTAMRALADAIVRHGKVFDLRTLSQTEIATLARDAGITLQPPTVKHLHDTTGGVRGAVLAAIGALITADRREYARTVESAVGSWAARVLDDEDPQLLSTLALAAAGAGLEAAEVADVIGVDERTARELIDRARGNGLVSEPDLLLPAATDALRRALGERGFLDVQRRMLAVRLGSGALRTHTALRLAQAGLQDPRLAEFLSAQARLADPAPAAELWRAAAAAGARNIELRLAETLALAGDMDAAAAQAESLLTAPEGAVTTPDQAAAVRICASSWAARGMLRRAAELYAWLGPDRVGSDGGIAATVLFAAGRPDPAHAMLRVGTSGPPTDFAAGSALVGHAVAQSLHGPARTAVTQLVQAATMFGTHPRALPIDPLLLAAQLCLNSGDLPRARTILGRATGAQARLLAAWTALLAGEENIPTELDVVHRRDRFAAVALELALARRSGDHGGLLKAWAQACDLVDDVSVDLLTLLPLGELWLAAIRLGEADRVAHLVAEAAELLAALGEPPAWASTFHWYGVQAAILREDPPALLPHAAALKAATAVDPFSATLAGAGRVWLQVLGGGADPADVEAAAAALGAAGLAWDGARLASEAALRASDTATATRLLTVARGLRYAPRRAERAEAPATAVTPITATAQLSDREGEVANLLVLGMTYRDIGARLYISAKTVEHHVARIRRRLGADSRAELLSMLRAMGHGVSGAV